MSEPTAAMYEAAARAYCRQQFNYPPEVYVHGQVGADAHLARDAAATGDADWLHAVVDESRRLTLTIAARGLLAETRRFSEKWCVPPGATVSGRRSRATDSELAASWDKGYVRGMAHAAHTLANSIDRPELLADMTPEATP